MTVRLIQGFFRQQWCTLGTGFDETGDLRVYVSEGMCRFMFAGTIFPGPGNALGDLSGEMNDHFGPSHLANAVVLQDEVRFDKKYDNRRDVIHYHFRRQGSFWVGEYEGPAVGRGEARCIITEVPEEFFAFGN